MSAELFRYYVEKRKRDRIFGHYLIINARLQPPLEVEYNIHSFGDRRDVLDPKEAEQWERAGGLDAFLEYRMLGYSTSPEQFIDCKCELMVNPLGSVDHIENRARGVIGDGWLENGSFLFRVWIPHHVAEAFLRHITTPDRRYITGSTALELLRKWKEDPGEWQREENRLDLLKNY